MKKIVYLLLPLLAPLIPASAIAHPGHGLGSLGHGLDHALWNFAGVVAVCVVVFLLRNVENK